ncbi:MAG: C4-type zinc ribbon domain-containing protein [Marinisporobacter sp.]|jgi:predicted  nucleic acid-binding Zn-ribbon protein|nr:C4-type zinc ribbon domain-containing protein [Marinisporobacter sp.]
MNQNKILWKYQEIERILEKEEKVLKEVIKGKEISQRIKKHKLLKNNFETKKNILKEQENRLRKVEHERTELEYEIEIIKNQLYGGKINDLKQLENLMKKEEQKKIELNEIDSRTLEMMEEMDIVKEDLKGIGCKGRELGKIIKNMLEERKRTIEKIEKYIMEKKIEKEEITNKITKENIEKYMDIKSRKKDPVAMLKGDICMGCHMDLPVMTLTKLKAKGIIVCNNCGRILYPCEEE